MDSDAVLDHSLHVCPSHLCSCSSPSIALFHPQWNNTYSQLTARDPVINYRPGSLL
jgi:hypothetical protein